MTWAGRVQGLRSLAPFQSAYRSRQSMGKAWPRVGDTSVSGMRGDQIRLDHTSKRAVDWMGWFWRAFVGQTLLCFWGGTRWIAPSLQRRSDPSVSSCTNLLLASLAFRRKWYMLRFELGKEDRRNGLDNTSLVVSRCSKWDFRGRWGFTAAAVRAREAFGRDRSRWAWTLFFLWLSFWRRCWRALDHRANSQDCEASTGPRSFVGAFHTQKRACQAQSCRGTPTARENCRHESWRFRRTVSWL